mmetsp:Transcript_14532/g.42568  ORF Transcript_14532/g.42568 Transcript_14532/m.42568 type:complete len:259 (-) Transcript_14532:516-1292(-)
MIFFGEVRHVHISVLEPCVQNQPCIDDKKRSSVQSHHLRHTIACCPGCNDTNSSRNPNITRKDLLLPVAREQLLLRLVRCCQRIGVKVVCHSSRWTPSSSNEQISRPANNKVEKSLHNSPRFEPILLPKLFHEPGPLLVTSFVRRLNCLRNVRLPELHVVRILMVNCMTPLPGVVWDQQSRVQDVPNCVLQLFVFGESTVSALVRQDPKAHRNSARHRRVGRPERKRPNGLWGQDLEHVNAECCAQSCPRKGNREVPK